MKIRNIAASAALSAAALSIMSATASAYEHTAFLMFTDSGWLWSNWSSGAGKDANVTGPGTYTVSIDSTQAENASSPASGANVFCVDILDACADLEGFEVTLDSIKADGKQVPFDPDKICYGDIEEKGTYRIEIHNSYGKTGSAGDPHFGAIDFQNFSAASSIEVTFTVKGAMETAAPVTQATTAATTTEATTPAPIKEVIDENGKPNGDNTDTKVSPTGNASPSALMCVMAVAAAAAFIAKKTSE